MSIFNAIKPKPQDPIFGLYQEYLLDKRQEKLNLGIGTFRKEDGLPYVLDSVKEAEKRLLNHLDSKEYLPIEGDPVFIEEMSKVLFRDKRELFLSVQTPGGAMALRLVGELLKQMGIKKVLISDPTWPNHLNIFSSFEIVRYAYPPDLASLSKQQDGAIVLQPACHNPTGIDLPQKVWDDLLAICKQNRLIPIFDIAYFGLKGSYEAEMYPLFKALEMDLECFVTSSFSKNFGLYAERIGLLSIFTKADRQALLSNLKVVIRSIYSNPPQHGSLLIREILLDPQLKKMWEGELEKMRRQIHEARRLFGMEGSGMFSLLPLTKEQIERLKKEQAIYLPLSGRINFASINKRNIGRIQDAIKSVG